jgi:ribosomal peptide maturation radical SAM protein 1
MNEETPRDSEAGRDPMRVALINMPWARAEVPSIQCGLLKAELQARGYPADVHYLNMELAALLGPDPYRGVMSLHAERSHLVGEWLFSATAFDERGDEEAYFADIGDEPTLQLTRADLVALRNEVLPKWIARVAADARWSQYAVVGFTTTFEQNVASLALARRLKEHYPHIITVFGGANFDDTMGPEYVRAIPWIDYAVIGEGDRAFPEFIDRLATGRDPSRVPGVCSRAADGTVVGARSAPQVTDMNSVPAPDYGEYFEAIDRLGRLAVLGTIRPHLLYESSRGCWWGEKHHCTFCGLNGMGMKYRAKSAETVLHNIRHLTEAYRVLCIDVVDNILDMSYLRSILPRLAAEDWDLQIFYEVKANLTAEQLRMLRDAGVVKIQPGIESLSTHVLDLMRKGSSLLINLRLLKWAQIYGIDTFWNILSGFPGETDEDYERQIELIPSLHHLKPPGGCGPIWLERFSPYFFDPSFPIQNVKASAAYRHVYPAEVQADKVAYYFEYVAQGTASLEVRARLGDVVAEWQALWATENQPPTLRYERGPGWLRINDTRGGSYREAVLDGWRGLAYEYCTDKARSAAGVGSHLTEVLDDGVSEHRVTRFLEACVAERLMAGEDGRFLSLALPARSKGTKSVSSAVTSATAS